MAGGEKALHKAGAERGLAPARAGLNRSAGLHQAAAALTAWAATLLIFWPGIALYDSVEQYRQALAGDYDDWHPPIMARLWSLFVHAWPGGGPMLLVQASLYWLGLGLIAAACARRGRGNAGLAVLGIGAYFLASCWLGALLKDAQMVGALAAAVGIIGWWRLDGRKPPGLVKAAALLLLGYAALLRANAVFAVVPLGFVLLGVATAWRPVSRAMLGLVAIAASILLSSPVNHRLLGAEASGVEKSLLVYDLAGIDRGARSPVAPPRCYSALEWDPAGEPGCPGFARLHQTDGRVAAAWAGAVLAHPLAYAAHRLAHFDATMRLYVPAGLPHAVAPVHPEPNRLGLGAEPGAVALALHRIGLDLAEIPVSWPSLWLALDLIAVWAAAEMKPDGVRDVVLGLSLSALVLGGSFLVVSVASDLRYHLWTMIAAALSLILLADSGALRRRQLTGLALLGIVVATMGIVGRLVLPPFA